MRPSRPVLVSTLLGASLGGCFNDPALIDSATGTATTGDTTSSASTSGEPSTSSSTEAPTTGVGATSSTSAELTTDVSTTDATTLSSSSSTTDANSSGSGGSSTTDAGSSSTGGGCGPGSPGPDEDGDTVPDACDLCPAGAEFVAGAYDAGQQLGPYPTIHIARQAQKVLVTWFDRAGAPANHRIAYTLLDDKCQPIAANKTAIAIPDGYLEFHDAAIDAAGKSVVAVSPNATYVNFIDAVGVAKSQQEAFDINAVYGTHVALNQATGAGILAAQIHSGSGIYYRRFKADGSWVEAAAVQVPVNYHYWYDGFTVGMNDKDNFVFLWRSGGTALDLRFFKPDGGVAADVKRTTIDFEGWNGGHCYDSFRLRHQEIPLRGDNFVLGEVYNWITPQQNRVVHHFEYTPAGVLVVEDSTTINLPEGLTIRTDQLGASYLRGPAGITILADYP